MNLKKDIYRLLFFLCSLLVVTASCSDDEEEAAATGRPGYLQLRLMAENTATRAMTSMAEAKKIIINLDYNGMTVAQTLALTAVEGAEDAGLTTEKLELLPGDYKLMSYVVLGAVEPGKESPRELLTAYPEAGAFSVTAGHITELELTVKAILKGKVSFQLIKDLTAWREQMEQTANTRAAATQTREEELFQYDQIASVELTCKKGTQAPRTLTLDVHQKSGQDFLHTDTVDMELGTYVVSEMKFYNKNRQYLILVTNPDKTLTISQPTILTEQQLPVTYPANSKAIKDYIVLYNIWTAMDGPNWSYAGESFPTGANWRFKDRDIDEWGNQPGVTLDSDGRVKSLDLGSFNPAGDIPETLGDLDELETLWLGTHNDTALEEGELGGYSATMDLYALYRKGVDLQQNRMAIARERMALRHPRKASPLRETKQPAFTYATPIDATYDLDKGTLTNRITSLPQSIGKLSKLEYLYVANGKVKNLPETLAQLESLTDMELYNCQLEEFPQGLAGLKNLISLNLSNTTIEGDDKGLQMTEGLNQLAKNATNFQILYANNCGLTSFPMNFLDAENLVLLDLSGNRLEYLPQKENAMFKPKFAPIQAFFDDNRISRIDEFFCGTDDVEEFSASNNLLTEFPLIFNQTAVAGKYTAETIDLSHNKISSFEGFKGIRANTLTLSGNPIGELRPGKGGTRFFPAAFCEAVEDGKYPHRISLQLLETANCDIDSISYKNGFECFKYLEAWDLSGNRLRAVPSQFNVEAFPYLTGLSLNYNAFAEFPIQVFYVQKLYKLFIAGQTDRSGERRCLRTFPSGLNTVFGLRYLDVSGNDIRIISESDFPATIFEFNVSDNPNLEMAVPSDICTKITTGEYTLYFDEGQYITGCPILTE